MAFRDRCRGLDRAVVRCLLIVQTIFLFACAGCATASEENADVNSDVSELLGQHVMISFKWAEPTSVLESLIVEGMLVRADEELLVVDLGPTTRTEQQERVIEALERGGKLRRDPDGRTVHVLRKEVADLRSYPRI